MAFYGTEIYVLTQSTDKEYLFSDNPIEQAFGRLQATSIAEDLHAYLMAELARGTTTGELVVVLANYFVSFHASVVGSWFDASEINRGKKILREVMDSTYRKTALVSNETCSNEIALAHQGQ